jgi:protein phosphatase
VVGHRVVARDLAEGPAAAQLSRAVGIWPTVPIDLVMAAPAPDDVYLLCSDGLTKMLDDDAIADVLRTHDDPANAVEQLVAQALARGGRDNVTVILVRIVPPHWTPRSRTGPSAGDNPHV